MNTQKLSSHWLASASVRLGVLLCLAAALGWVEDAHSQSVAISNIWTIPTTEGRTYVTGATDTERGVAFNPFTGHAYIVSRNGGLTIAIVDAQTGAHFGTLDVSGISGGDFALNQIGVADDGYIYAANLTTSSTNEARPFKIYRWTDESATPAIVYASSPSGNQSLRFGDSIDVRGSGTETEIIAGTGGVNATNLVAVFRPLDATISVFTSRAIIVPRGLNILATDFAKGIAFGPGGTFFAKNNGTTTTAKLCSYDWESGTGAWIRNYAVAGSIAAIDYDPATGLLAGVLVGSATAQHALLVYDVSDEVASLVYSNNFPPPLGANGNAVNAVNINSNRVVAVEPRNGVQMAGISVSTNLAAPNVIQQPGNLTLVQGGYGSLSVNASGSKPRLYRWRKDDVDVPNATNRILTFTNVPLSAAGAYSVTISNILGGTNSNAGNLTIMPATLSTVLTQVWRIEPGNVSYPWLLTDNNARGMAYNPAR
ncbi:MAG TPA: hypothetical protein VK530_06145, partial [Candidatus Acidoferrum sp.]|nr:hypothetical protein [Candidatus Acidoferrum sp.]